MRQLYPGKGPTLEGAARIGPASEVPKMIHKYNAKSLSMWNHDELKVMLLLPGQTRPMGYCQGSDQDEQELRDMAEAEGVDDLKIHKRLLKTGREHWTLGEETVETEWVEDVD